MSIRFVSPCAALAEVVSRLYIHEIGVIGGDPWLIAPDGDLKLIFPVKGAIRCSIGGASRVHQPARIIVSGFRTNRRFTGMTPRIYARTADYGRFYIPATS